VALGHLFGFEKSNPRLMVSYCACTVHIYSSHLVKALRDKSYSFTVARGERYFVIGVCVVGRIS